MATNREVVSKLVNVFKYNNKDDRKSRRFLLRILKDTATQLISQKWLDRTILSEANLYTTINCLEFKQITVKECPSVEFRMCDVLMKSVKPLPKLVFSRLGASIKQIVSLDGNFKFTLVDESQYRRNRKRQYKLKDEVYIYLGSDNHLYIPDQEIYSVDLTVLTVHPEDAQDCSECNDEKCKSFWSFPFIVPDKLLDVVFDRALQVLGMSASVRADENPNNQIGQ